jgi:hypothetical protein
VRLKSNSSRYITRPRPIRIDLRDSLILISISRQCISLRTARAMFVGGCVRLDSNAVSSCGGIIMAFHNVVDSVSKEGFSMSAGVLIFENLSIWG